jgi:hypothetical protein
MIDDVVGCEHGSELPTVGSRDARVVSDGQGVIARGERPAHKFSELVRDSRRAAGPPNHHCRPGGGLRGAELDRQTAEDPERVELLGRRPRHIGRLDFLSSGSPRADSPPQSGRRGGWQRLAHKA